ncbi:IS481 family transposase [Streptomyces hirsutus]|uniref:IS481 family transposase n=1 Tax=Streptomyces hirsutus TaxID=35620 RepID=UPI002DD7DE55|nr:IS481 family transposase [Streptomyces hirsutus]
MRAPVPRPAREDSPREYRRIHGEPAAPDIKAAACPVGKILKKHGIPPGPERQSTTRADFPRSRADAPPARALFEVRTPAGARLYVFAVLAHATRRIRVPGAAAQWIVQPGRNLLMDLQDAGSKASIPIRDRDAKCTTAFDALVADAGPKAITPGLRMPRTNSLLGRWLPTCRRELLDRTLI